MTHALSAGSRFCKPVYDGHKLIEFDGFHETTIPVELPGFVGSLPVTRHDDYWDIPEWACSESFHELLAVHARHHQVEQN